MIKKIEHIGIAVEDLKQAIPIYEKIFGVPCYKQEREMVRSRGQSISEIDRGRGGRGEGK